ncbi:superoxide dismutase [Caulobacter sp. NIBR2454]|uniref:superoxide dismutase n=1 Tax=Caulobacter sp. NIBR2454 TaxID=3015996 RepID=UPI0022B6AC61|nr:superoxide dismutase [Caulobacter sp. NIBR2454]
MFVLPDLPYAYDAIEPVVSAKTFTFHHDKHHKAYVDMTNTLVGELGLTGKTMEEVVLAAVGDKSKKKLFNNAAQSWNHAFFWDAMTPDFKAPEGELKAAIEKTFGDIATLKEKFVAEGIGHFGSGWVWLAVKSGELVITSTHDGENLLDQPDLTPLLVCDLWEHAYYLDHQNNRKGFLEAWFDKAANWSLAASQLKAAQGGGEGWRYPAPQ